MKDKLRMKLKSIYQETLSVDYTIELAKALLKSTTHKDDKEFRSTIHGEIAETLLEILLLDYIRRNGLDKEKWFVKRGLILKDVNNPNSDFLTELDVTLFTPKGVVLFECKSYAGDIVVEGKGVVKRDGKAIGNVYNQNSLHRNTLHTNIKIASKSGENTKLPIYKIAYFHFAIGTITDNRSEKYIKYMPIINCKNVNTFLDTIKDRKRVYWDINKLERICDIIDKNNSKRVDKHLAYVKSKH